MSSYSSACVGYAPVCCGGNRSLRGKRQARFSLPSSLSLSLSLSLSFSLTHVQAGPATRERFPLFDIVNAPSLPGLLPTTSCIHIYHRIPCYITIAHYHVYHQPHISHYRFLRLSSSFYLPTTIKTLRGIIICC